MATEETVLRVLLLGLARGSVKHRSEPCYSAADRPPYTAFLHPCVLFSVLINCSHSFSQKSCKWG